MGMAKAAFTAEYRPPPDSTADLMFAVGQAYVWTGRVPMGTTHLTPPSDVRPAGIPAEAAMCHAFRDGGLGHAHPGTQFRALAARKITQLLTPVVERAVPEAGWATWRTLPERMLAAHVQRAMGEDLGIEALVYAPVAKLRPKMGHFDLSPMWRAGLNAFLDIREACTLSGTGHPDEHWATALREDDLSNLERTAVRQMDATYYGDHIVVR